MAVSTGPPSAIVNGTTRAGAACWTPGTAAIARTAEGLMPSGPEVTTASAPVACHDAAVSPRTTAARTTPVNDATVSAMTSVMAGRASVSGGSPCRGVTITAGTARSTGAALAYRLVAPGWVRKTVMPPMAAAQAVTSTTTLGSH